MTDVKAVILDASAIADAGGTVSRPGSVAVAAGRILAAGEPGHVRREIGADAEIRDLAGRLILPAMVNAHAHLDLTAVGTLDYGGDFSRWLIDVTHSRPASADETAASVIDGAAQSRSAGVALLGDIANAPQAVMARFGAALPGVSYLECFGHGRFAAEGIAKLNAQLDALPIEQGGVAVGITPHAPFTASHELYAHAAALGRERGYHLCTHLAESKQEEQFTRDAAGMFVDHLRLWRKWDDSIRPTGMHPVNWIEPHLKRATWLVAHCNYVEDDHIELLASYGASVAYCPVASEYFGHRGHRYREMIDAGANVCLGTDSIVCQARDEPQPMGILPQMRRLYQRDRTDPRLLLKMATINGCHALRLKEPCATLQPGAPADLISVRFDPTDPTDALTQVLQNRYPVEPVIKVETHT